MNDLPVAPKKAAAKLPPVRMVRFVCSRCDRTLVWADVSASVKCPSCGRWIRANNFWQGNGARRKGKKPAVAPEQLALF